MRKVGNNVYHPPHRSCLCRPASALKPVPRFVEVQASAAQHGDRAAKRPRKATELDDPGAAADEADPPARARAADARTWADRQERVEAAWAQKMPEIRQELRTYAKKQDTQQQQRRVRLLSEVQARLDAERATWSDSHSCGAEHLSTTEAPMRYVQLLSSRKLMVPTVTCNQPGCNHSFTPSAISVGCFPPRGP